MTERNSLSKESTAEEIGEWVDDAFELSRELGLDPYDVRFWIVDHDEMNELIAYDGFQTRYPHWRWGMKYDQQRKQGEYLGGKAFEIVNNDDPAHAFLQQSNSMADQKAVVTHVLAHSDFFKNNRWYSDSPSASSMLARHADRVQEIMNDPEIDRSEVESLIDTMLCIEDTIDQHGITIGMDVEDVPSVEERVESIDIDESIKNQVFDDEWIESQDDDRSVDLTDDVMGFLLEHGKRYDEEENDVVELEEWEKDVIRIIREEAYYFAPQKMTKVMNEGWACVDPETRIVTTDGIIPMEELVAEQGYVSDNSTIREVVDSNIIEDHDTITIETKSGYTITGSNNHRVRTLGGEWVRLDELAVGDSVEIAGGNDVWSDEYKKISWTPPDSDATVRDVADLSGYDPSTVYEYLNDGYISDEAQKSIASAIETLGWTGERSGRVLPTRKQIDVKGCVDECVGKFLGYQISEGTVAGDGTSNPNVVQQVSGNRFIVEDMAEMMERVLGLEPSVELDETRWRVRVNSVSAKGFLVDEFGLPSGASSDERFVPDQIFRSPRSVVVEFLRALFAGDGYAGGQGVIYSTSSEQLSKDIQELLLNFGIQSNRTEQSDGCWHVHMTGASAQKFADEVGFFHPEKNIKLDHYLDDLMWFEDEMWEDEIVEIETGTGDVYDITVEETHQYAGGGFVNHNSHWETVMMANEGFADENEFVEYADHHSMVLESPGFNPYRLGREIWEYVENDANRREVLDKLLRIDGVTPANFHRTVDFGVVEDVLRQSDSYSPAVRNFSLVRPENRGYLRNVSSDVLESVWRYVLDKNVYDSIEEALSDVNYNAGWDRMFEVRETHTDATFIDEFVTEEFIERSGFFAYGYNPSHDMYEVSSVDPEDVKQQMLLNFTNFGKPTIVVETGNFRNQGELMLAHLYNGISLNIDEVRDVLERIYDVWGRPVRVKTIVKDDDGSEQGMIYGYSKDGHYSSEFEDTDLIEADEIDYDVRPNSWLQ